MSKGQSNPSSEKLINDKTLEDIYRKNFEIYFQEINKITPQYLQAITKLQESFLEGWKNTLKMTMENQEHLAKQTGVDIQIPQESADLIFKVAEEYLKVKNNQNQSILTTLDTIRSNIKNFNENSQSFNEINKKLLDSWFMTYSENNGNKD